MYGNVVKHGAKVLLSMQPRAKCPDCHEGITMARISLSLIRVENQVGSPVLEELTEEGSWEKPCGSRSSFWAARWVDVLQGNYKHKRTGITSSQTVQCKAFQRIFHLCPSWANSHLFGNQPQLGIFHLFVCLHLYKPPA